MKRDHDAFDLFDDDAAAPAPAAAPFSSPLRGLFTSFLLQRAPAVSSDLRGADAATLADSLDAALRDLASVDWPGCVRAATALDAGAWASADRAAGWPHPCVRDGCALAQLLLALAAESGGERAEALARLDRAFILGGPRDLLREGVALLLADSAAAAPPPSPPADDASAGSGVADVSTAADPTLALMEQRPERRIARAAAPADAEGLRPYWKESRPVVLEGALRGWPALEKWHDLRALRRAHGARLVPVELGVLGGGGGGAGGGGGWSERVMPLRDFIDGHLVEGARGGVAYLAQHALFEQLPALQADFAVPPYCALGPSGGPQHVNAWLGTAATVTPLHFDSYDNLFAQVVGKKYVRLYAATETPKLYVRRGGGGGVAAQGNVSEVDVEAPDAARHPRFAEAQFTEVVLGPGDLLFVPAGVWHYVRSLTTSWSISFWF